MVTGDNLETAISVSQEVGIIDPDHQGGFIDVESIFLIEHFYESII